MLRSLAALAATTIVLAGGGIDQHAPESRPAARTEPQVAGGDCSRTTWPGRAHPLRTGAIRISARSIGIAASELVEALRAGDSVAQVAQAHDVAADEVVEDLVDAAEERIAGALEAGRITQTRAEHLRERARGLAERFVNGSWRHRRG